MLSSKTAIATRPRGFFQWASHGAGVSRLDNRTLLNPMHFFDAWRRLLPVLLLASPLAQAGGHGPSWGEHGMALFGGREALYASHLPMFHAPHDRQVVLQFHLADPVQDQALRRRLHGKTALWTIAPEKFELDRLAPGATRPLTHFKAAMVRGHFEQGGQTEMTGATVVVDKVLVYRPLSGALKTAKLARYQQIGSGQRRYLVKEIDSRPDFDHIVAVRVAKDAPTTPVVAAKEGIAQTPEAALAAGLGKRATVLGTVYYFTDDLK